MHPELGAVCYQGATPETIAATAGCLGKRATRDGSHYVLCDLCLQEQQCIFTILAPPVTLA